MPSTKPNSVSELLAARAELTPDAVVVRCGAEAVTARELDARASRLARGLLGLGLQPGDRVGVLLPTSMPFIELIFACARAGLVQVPLNAFLKGDFLVTSWSTVGRQHWSPTKTGCRWRRRC